MKQIQIFTDGSCLGNPGPGGYAAILKYGPCEKEVFGGFSNTTNSRMEIFAAIAAFEIVKTPCEVTLFSDSIYLVNAIEKGWLSKWRQNGWKTSGKKQVHNIDLWERLDAAMNGHCLRFVWVKGHADNPFNNRCDVLARKAASSQNLPEDAGYKENIP